MNNFLRLIMARLTCLFHVLKKHWQKSLILWQNFEFQVVYVYIMPRFSKNKSQINLRTINEKLTLYNSFLFVLLVIAGTIKLMTFIADDSKNTEYHFDKQVESVYLQKSIVQADTTYVDRAMMK